MNEIELYSKIQNPVEAITQLGQHFARSGLAGCTNEAQGIILAWECAAKRKSPSDIMAENDIVQGRLRRKALAIAARFQEAGGKIEWIKTGEEGLEARARYTIDGQTVEASFTIEKARKQGIVRPDSQWIKRPEKMLRKQCHIDGIGMLRPGLVLGMDADDDPETEQRMLLPTQPTAPQAAPTEPTATEPKAAKVTEVTTIAPEPQPQAQPAAAPEPPAKREINWSNPRDSKKVSAEGAQALAEAIGDTDQEKVLRWLEEQKWILPGGSLLDLTPARAISIHRDTPKFIAFVKNGGKKG